MKRYVILFTIACSVLTARAVPAQTALGLEAIGGSIGMVSPEDLGSTFGLGAFADWGTIMPDLGLESRIDYWSKSENVFGFESSVRDIQISARAKYLFELEGSPIRPFAGGGLGMHFIKSEVTVPVFFGLPGASTSASDTKLGVDLGGGFATKVGTRTDLVGEGWYSIVSNMGQLALRVGLSYRLGS